MTTSEELALAWTAVAGEPRGRDGLYERRVSLGSIVALFAGISYPSGHRILVIDVEKKAIRSRLPRVTRAFQVKVEVGLERARILVEQTHDAFSDLFAVMCGDVASAASASGTDKDAVRNIVGRIDHWCRFAETALDGLPLHRQVGLFGELFLIRLLILWGKQPSGVVESWVGATGENHDFMFGPVALEVKATTAVDDTEVLISNERQLDSTGTDLLLLAHFSFDKRPNAGTTLPALVSELEGLILPPDLLDFRDRLLSSGYSSATSGDYDQFGYTLRRNAFYQVMEGFPRLIPCDLPGGVHEVSYALDLSAAGGFVRDEAWVLSEINL